jgi:glycosyltransferase involved in cell wall biosynthesis
LDESELWNVEWEEKCFGKASIVCLTSKKTIEFYKKKYPQFSEKFQLYPNVYDLAELKPNSNPQNKKSSKNKFLYTGGLTQERNPKILLECLNELFIEQPELMLSSSFQFFGPKDSYVTNLFKEFPLPFVENKGPVTYFESKKIQKKADVLLILDAPITDPNKAVYFPSKLLDYMIVGKPILAVSPSFSTTTEVINEHNLGGAYDHYEKSGIKTFILDCLKGSMDFSINQAHLPKDFDVNFNVNRLYNLFLQLNEKG